MGSKDTEIQILDDLQNEEIATREKEEETNPIFELDGRKIADILLRQDYSSLSSSEQIAFIKYKCDRLGLDITANPFIFISAPTKSDPGRKLLINTKNLYAHLTIRYSIEVAISKASIISVFGKSYIQVKAKATIPASGASCEDIGVVFIDKSMQPIEIANFHMKAATKAKCRAIHNVAGVGGLSYAEAKDLGVINSLAPANIPGKRLMRLKK